MRGQMPPHDISTQATNPMIQRADNMTLASLASCSLIVAVSAWLLVHWRFQAEVAWWIWCAVIVGLALRFVLVSYVTASLVLIWPIAVAGRFRAFGFESPGIESFDVHFAVTLIAFVYSSLRMVDTMPRVFPWPGRVGLRDGIDPLTPVTPLTPTLSPGSRGRGGKEEAGAYSAGNPEKESEEGGVAGDDVENRPNVNRPRPFADAPVLVLIGVSVLVAWSLMVLLPENSDSRENFGLTPGGLRSMTFVLLFGTGWMIVSAVHGLLGIYDMSRAESSLYLRNAFARELRGELSRIERNLARADRAD